MSRKPAESATRKQSEVLEYILNFLQEHCYQPSTFEMAAHFGISTAAVAERLKGLAAHGLVKLRPGGYQRAITIVGVRCTVTTR
jgi:SOS-response transcriptional repressor LexA